jgi:ABC-type Na+ efflux pump permease subunit
MAIWTLAGKDMRLLLRDTRAAIILLLIPPVFMFVLGLIMGESVVQKPDSRLRVSIVDEDVGPPAKEGPSPTLNWSQVVLKDLNESGGINVEVIPTYKEAERLKDRSKRAAVIIFRPNFSKKVNSCSFMEKEFTGGQQGINPFYRDGMDLKALDLELMEDPKQPTAAAIIRQVIQVSLLRVVMSWMIGSAFDKIADKQFIDELAKKVEVDSPIGKGKFRPLGILNDKQKAEVGNGVQDALLEMFKQYNLRGKSWNALSNYPPAPPAEGGSISAYEGESGGILNRGALRYQFLVPAATVMFSFFMVLAMGWLFVAERRQGTLVRLRAAPLTRGQILVGKMLPCLAVSLFQGVFLLVAGTLAFGMKWGPRPWLLPVVVTATSFASVGLAMMVASLARTEFQVAIFGTFLVLMLGIAGGCVWPREQMPEPVQAWTQVTPQAWALDAYQELLLANPNLGSVLISCGVLAAFGIVFTGLAWLLLKLD